MKRHGKKIQRGIQKIKQWIIKKEPGVDGILVTVGLCVIALLLCVVMKDALTTFVTTLVTEMTNEAKALLTGVNH